MCLDEELREVKEGYFVEEAIHPGGLKRVGFGIVRAMNDRHDEKGIRGFVTLCGEGRGAVARFFLLRDFAAFVG